MHKRRMNNKQLSKDFRKKTGYGTCEVENCTVKAEVELTKGKEKIKYATCWKHGFVILQQSYANLARSQELFDRVHDNCYECVDLRRETENAIFLMIGMKAVMAKQQPDLDEAIKGLEKLWPDPDRWL